MNKPAALDQHEGFMNEAMRREIEKIYVESWQKGLSVPFFDTRGTSIWLIPTAAKTA